MGRRENVTGRKSRSAFGKATLRSIRGSLGRFLAIMGIAALGCGFFAGLKMCGPDMRAAGDAWYDGTHLWDLRLISTLGFSDDDAQRVAAVRGVGDVMPSRTLDAMARLGSQQSAVRIQSLDVDAARNSQDEGLYVMSSDDDSYLNRVQLEDGRLPEAEGECVAYADAPGTELSVGDTVELLYGSTDLGDLLRTTTLTVVGTVASSNYPYTANFGSTTLGTGQIDQVLFVPPAAFVDDAPYTELYATVDGAAETESESDAYWDVVDDAKQRVERDLEPLEEARLDDLKAQAQEQLDARRSEYESQRADAESQLDDAKEQLESSLAELQSGEEQYQEGKAQYEASKAQYDAGVAQYNAGASQYESGEEQYQAGVDALLQGVSDGLAQAIDAGLALRDELQAQVDAYEAAGVTPEAYAALLDAIDRLSTLANMDPTVNSAEEAWERVQEVETALDEARLALAGVSWADLPTSQAVDLSALLAQVGTELVQTRSQLASAAGGVSQLVGSRSQLDGAQTQLIVSKSQLDSAATQLQQAAQQLESSRAQLDSGWEQYNAGLAEYEQSRQEADGQFADAEAQLESAQEEIDELTGPDIYVLDRSQSEGAVTYHADTERMDHIAAVFPLMFFLVAALVSLTTMTRMVEGDRVEIGTYKALGYSTSRIASKYLVYAGIASGVGAVVGIAALSQVLPYIVIESYAIIYAVPIHPFPQPVSWGIALAAGGIGVGITLLATWGAVVSSLRETPATLMLPRAPKAGRRILLEHIRPLWAHLSFSWKVTFRNLFRYKRRLLMTVIGISGCTALLLVGFGLHDSIWDIIDKQYGPLVHYDTTVGLAGSATELDVENAVDYLTSTGGATSAIRVQQENMLAGAEGHEGTTRASVIIPRSAEELTQAITFRERISGRSVTFDDNAVLVTEKLASLYDLSPGSSVLLYDQDDVGNARGEGHALVVTGVVENYVGNFVYVGRNAWHAVDEDEPAFSTIYASVPGDDASHEELGESLHDLSNVATVVFSDETVQTYRTMLSVVDAITVVLIVCAGMLAFIVLYNLTNINIEERVREIASLKVLGFTRGEVYAYVFREILLLALLGDVVGMLLGTWLETFTITAAEVDYVMFGREIHPLSYLYAFAITMAFAVAIVFLMRHKLDRVDMVESLKSVD